MSLASVAASISKAVSYSKGFRRERETYRDRDRQRERERERERV